MELVAELRRDGGAQSHSKAVLISVVCFAGYSAVVLSRWIICAVVGK
jgi:hypothetical protein